MLFALRLIEGPRCHQSLDRRFPASGRLLGLIRATPNSLGMFMAQRTVATPSVRLVLGIAKFRIKPATQ